MTLKAVLLYRDLLAATVPARGQAADLPAAIAASSAGAARAAAAAPVASPAAARSGSACTGAPAGGMYSGIHALQPRAHLGVVGGAVALAPRDHLPDRVAVRRARLRDAQLRVRRRQRRLLGREQLLVELLARAAGR